MLNEKQESAQRIARGLAYMAENRANICESKLYLCFGYDTDYESPYMPIRIATPRNLEAQNLIKAMAGEDDAGTITWDELGVVLYALIKIGHKPFVTKSKNPERPYSTTTLYSLHPAV